MSAPDQVLYAWIKSRLEGDSTISTAKVKIVRDDEDLGAINTPPKIAYSPLEGPGEDLILGGFGLTIHVERPRAFGTGDNPQNEGTLHDLDDAMISRIVNVRPTLSGFAASAISLGFRRRTTLDDPNIVTLRREFSISLIPGGSGVPLTGDDGDLTSAGINGKVERWQVDVDAPTDTDHTELADTVQRVTIGDPIASGFMDILPYSSATPFPTVGSEISVTFKTDTSASWTDTVLVTKYQWLRGEGQTVRMYFAVTNAGSPFYP